MSTQFENEPQGTLLELAEAARAAFEEAFQVTRERADRANRLYQRLQNAQLNSETEEVGRLVPQDAESCTAPPRALVEAAGALERIQDLMNRTLCSPGIMSHQWRDREKPPRQCGPQAPLWIVRWEDNTSALVRARNENDLAETLDSLADPNLAGWAPYDGPVFIEFSAPALVQDSDRGRRLVGCEPSVAQADDGGGMREAIVALGFTESGVVADFASEIDRGEPPSRLYRRSCGVRGRRPHAHVGVLTETDEAIRRRDPRRAQLDRSLGLDSCKPTE